MCTVCSARSDFYLGANWAARGDTFAFVPDDVGDRPTIFEPLLVTTTDTIPGDRTSDATLEVDGAHVVSTIDTLGDQDVFGVTLTAGVQYEIGMYGYLGGPSGLLLADSYIEIYDARGNLIVSGDGGASTVNNTINSGFDVLLSFTPTRSGTYFINARAYDNVPVDGTDGDLVGDYEVFVQTAPPGAYTPYYSPDSPLYALDWGSRVNRVNQSAANPDGNEGTRATGNAQGTPVVASEIAALAAEQGIDIAGKNVITIYFARAGDIFTSLEDPTSPGLPPVTVTAVGVQDFEREAVFTSLDQFSSVSDIVYIEVDNRDDADFVYTSYQGTPGPGVSLLGSMSPPDEPNEGLAQFNSGDERWNALNLQQGGFSFVTLIHEFGHGHGLAHPHDNGGRSGIMNGVEAEGAGVADYTTGDFALNQGVFTMMSYEDGWQSSPYGNAPTDVGYGYLGGLMAFDIAAIQDEYGVNEEFATGDDTYVLRDENAAGTFYSCIWDGGGTDRIVYAGSRHTVIDLRAATLRYEVGGGGWVSHATGIFGGFTIANGVTIENAASGAGNDLLVGNAAANVLDSGAGEDLLHGGAGRDTLRGGADADRLYGENGRDLLEGGAGDDRLFGGLGDDTLRGGDGADRLIGDAGIETMAGGAGNDVYHLRSSDSAGDTITELTGEGSDVVFADFSFTLGAHVDNLQLLDGDWTGTGNELDNIIGAGDGSNTLFGLDGDDRLLGGGGVDFLRGGRGEDRLVGDAGRDLATGGRDADVFAFQALGDSGASMASADVVTDFSQAERDRIDLSRIDAVSGTGGDQAFTFIGSTAFTAGTAGQLRAFHSRGNTFVEIDVNGDAVGDLMIRLNGTHALVAEDFVL